MNQTSVVTNNKTLKQIPKRGKIPIIKRPSKKSQRREEVLNIFNGYLAKKKEKPSINDFIRPKITCEIWGPAEAKKALEASEGNRNTRENHVKWLEKHMTEGKFVFGPPVVFDINGVFIGGHHRATAIIRCGKFVPLTVMRGADPKLREYTNQHKEVKLADELKYHGLSSGNARGAALNLAVELTSGCRIPVKTFIEYKDWDKVFPGLDWAMDTISGRDLWRQASIVGAFVYAHNTNPQAVKAFAKKMISGENLSGNDPVLAFRNWYLWYTASGKSEEDKKRKKKDGSAGGGDERKRVYTARVLHCIRAAIEKKKPRALKNLKPEIAAEDIAWFREANLTRKAKKNMSIWVVPRISSKEFIKYIMDN